LAWGGGLWGGTLANCTLVGNVSEGTDFLSGGGAAEATLNNCTLSGNSAALAGGGASGIEAKEKTERRE
jgi:hypothetical protein